MFGGRAGAERGKETWISMIWDMAWIWIFFGRQRRDQEEERNGQKRNKAGNRMGNPMDRSNGLH